VQTVSLWHTINWITVLWNSVAFLLCELLSAFCYFTPTYSTTSWLSGFPFSIPCGTIYIYIFFFRITTVFPFPADFMTKIVYMLLACSVPRSTALPSFLHSSNMWWTEQSKFLIAQFCSAICHVLLLTFEYSLQPSCLKASFDSQQRRYFFSKSVSEYCGYFLRE